VFESYSVCFANFRGLLYLKWAPCGPFHHHFDTLVVDKLCAKHAWFKDVFVSWSILLMHTKWELTLWLLKGLFSETYVFNKKSRTPVLRPLISFVMSWTQSMMKRNSETKQLHPTHLTQGTLAHRWSLEEDNPGFLHCPLFLNCCFHLSPRILDGP
jgi:hypothetical protein